MNLEQINKLIQREMNDVNQIIISNLDSNVSLINKLGLHIINSGGKRIRPIIAILSARSVDYQGKLHITNAALIEFIHTATLLHDDVVDKSCMRRGKITANIEFGNSYSVLVGDLMYAKAFQIMASIGSMKIVSLISKAIHIIIEGEVLQLINCKNLNISEEDYMNVIYNKTACLFEIAAQSSAIISNADSIKEKALKKYGMHLGIAFQLIDDILDYCSNNKKLGKNIGNDLKEGKITLPLLHAIKNSTSQQKKIIYESIIEGNNIPFMQPIYNIMKQYGSLEWTRIRAEQEAKKAIYALNFLPKSPWRTALKAIANISINRNY
ncbi:octaprenyl diphosphate synthase [Candidatus Pantoea edessiphila]|uniref:Octaprenyl diphosphate synthase n=1 Tax=Candidatus Pantoea edessiphila TaxID=2044610 RepID=A0A2P5SY85_9GAMM|nr:octaprenyl diphosphate synthase [Candidatus Pantoea edessiphila]MBK4775648.1 octaprenyl diphosphate synthase [Pantoea sp. Edef]PPI87294.1 octaprenyl diphosphate synthase [Candidatus Pantoea edessiphila]